MNPIGNVCATTREQEFPHEPEHETLLGMLGRKVQEALQWAGDVATRREIDCTHDADPNLCGSERLVGQVRLFYKQAGEVDVISVDDVTQAGLADCHLMACLAALAGCPEGRELIKRAVVENKDAQGNTVSYSVTLFDRGVAIGAAPPLHPLCFTVDARFSPDHAVARDNEIWPLVIEKAYAQLLNGYDKIATATSPARALEALTGHPAEIISMRVFHQGVPVLPPQLLQGGADACASSASPYSAAQIQGDLRAGKVVVLLTGDVVPEPNTHGLVPRHAYSVSAVDDAAGKLHVRAHNPWNQPKREPTPIPCDELVRCFVEIDVGRIH